MIFVDTNVLVYAAALHPEKPRHTAIARDLLRDARVVMSIQVIHEFYDRAVRKSKPVWLSDADAQAFIDTLRGHRIEPVTLAVYDAAIALRRRTNYRYYDCAIIASALLSGCSRLLSEDMDDGRVFDALTLENPFTRA